MDRQPDRRTDSQRENRIDRQREQETDRCTYRQKTKRDTQYRTVENFAQSWSAWSLCAKMVNESTNRLAFGHE